MVEKELVSEKLKELNKYIKQLHKYQGIEVNDLEEDFEKCWSIERGLQLSIQLVLDIGNHILASKGITADSYSSILSKLGKNDILPLHFAEKIKGMAGFRNILVHDYLEVDLELLVKIINNSLNDFEKFIEYIINYIDY